MLIVLFNFMNKIIYLIFFCSFFTITATCQSYQIRDVNTKDVIPFVNINVKDKKKGTYSNEYGVFNKDIFNVNDTILISHLNYNSLKIRVGNTKDTIFLTPKTEILKEVVLSKNKRKIKTVGYLKKNKNLSWFIQPQNELTTLIKYSEKYKEAYVSEIFIPIGKKIIRKNNGKIKKVTPKFSSVFKIHLYSNKNDLPFKKVLVKPIIVKCTHESEDILKVDISNQLIEFPKNGLFVAVEMLGELNNKGNLTNDAFLPSFKFTKKRKKNIKSISYTKFAFSNGKWVSIKDNKRYHKISDYNMAIGLKIDIVYD